MDVLKTTLHLGLERPVRILQVADVHLTVPWEGYNPKAMEKQAKKRKAFLEEAGGVSQEKRFAQALQVADGCDALVFTGDIADSPAPSNLAYLSGALEGRKYLYTFGNHDYYSYESNRGTPEDRELYLDEFLRFLPGDPQMDALQIGGVNLVALDDSLAQFSEVQLAFLKAEIAKGLPILLFLHLPIYSDAFAPKAFEMWESVMSVGAPPEVLASFGEDDPKMIPAAATLQVLSFMEKEPLIQAIFASHLHFDCACEVLGKPQFINKPCYLGSVREIRVE